MEKVLSFGKFRFFPIKDLEFWQNQRQRTLVTSTVCGLLLLFIFITAFLMGDAGLSTQLSLRKLPPSLQHPFGTDWLGRDMLTRTVKGLCLSLQVGLAAATISAVIALILGLLSAGPSRNIDRLITGIVDVCMSMPHLVLLILISFVMGGGARGVIVAVAASHWPRLTRIIRAEVLQLKCMPYIRLTAKFGKSQLWIACHHMAPHMIPQFLVGTLLLFPHAILHAAGLSFLGFGLSPHTPAIGILLSESMRYLSTGYWWLAVMPGVTLVATIKLFDILGHGVRILLTPKSSQL
jgi:peptide/nickel transport system permease protein